MEMTRHRTRALVALCCVGCGIAFAQGAAPGAAPGAAAAAAAAVGFGSLKGTWVRPDGGYQIVIGEVGKDGRLEAMYFNPSPLPFSKALANKAGETIRVSLELRAGGYDGSTYDLVYDPQRDRLAGIYYQAVVKQKYDVYFVRRTAR
jgi:uncharacterized protein (DUF2147 family)